MPVQHTTWTDELPISAQPLDWDVLTLFWDENVRWDTPGSLWATEVLSADIVYDANDPDLFWDDDVDVWDGSKPWQTEKVKTTVWTDS